MFSDPNTNAVLFTATVNYDGEGEDDFTNELAATMAVPDAAGNNPLVTANVSLNSSNGGEDIIVFTAIATGANTNYQVAINQSVSTDYPSDISGIQMNGGADNTVFDTGTLSVTQANGSVATATWGQGSTLQDIYSQLSSQLSVLNPIATYPSGTVLQIGLANPTPGSAGNGNLTCPPSVDTAGQTASFGIACNGMNGGADPSTNPPTIYGFTIPSPGTSTTGYAANGDLLSVSDQSGYGSVMGSWSYTYDNLNRLTTATANSAGYMGNDISGAAMKWGYDSFGNRLVQYTSTGALPSGSVQYTPGTNQAATTNLAYDPTISSGPSNPGLAVSLPSPDASGDPPAINGGQPVLFDAEGRLCAATNLTGSYTVYVYDAEGRRVAKGAGSGPSISCDPTSGFTMTNQYLLDLGGNQVTELNPQNPTMPWMHSNVYVGGKLLATYTPAGLEYQFTDWLGTKRVQASAAYGNADDICQSFPFGDGQFCTATDATEHHFTGKEWDTESGLDYFGARYYGSNMGRFMNPDDPFEDLDFSSPQSFNLYTYVRNNPLTNTDPSGNDCVLQTRSSDTSESYSVLTGTCNGVQVTDGEIATYVAGTVSGVQAGADGHSIDIGYTPYGANGDASTSVTNVSVAPIPDNTNLAFNWDNNAQGYQELDAASTVVKGATIAVGGTYALLGTAALATGVIGGEGASLAGVGRSGASLVQRLLHIFGDPTHDLGALVAKFGGPLAAYQAMQDAARLQVSASGPFTRVAITVGGIAIQINGTVIDGVVTISTAYVPH